MNTSGQQINLVNILVESVANNMKIILISGKMRSGKDQLASYMADFFEKLNMAVVFDKYAGDLKKYCSEDFKLLETVLNDSVASIKASLGGFCSTHFSQGLESAIYKQVESELDNLTIKKHNWFEDKTPVTRAILQLYGTETFRNRVDNMYWVNKLYNRVVSDKVHDVCIITDTRFPNELDVFEKELQKDGVNQAYSMRIHRGESLGGHPSETALDDYPCFDYVIDNNGTLTDLENTAKLLVYDIISKENKNG